MARLSQGLPNLRDLHRSTYIDAFPCLGVAPPRAGRLHPARRPVLADRVPSGDGWLHELKHDGFRIIARKESDHVRLWSGTAGTGPPSSSPSRRQCANSRLTS